MEGSQDGGTIPVFTHLFTHYTLKASHVPWASRDNSAWMCEALEDTVRSLPELPVQGTRTPCSHPLYTWPTLPS